MNVEPAPGRALRPYLAAVGLGDLAGYGQPQARAAIGAGGIAPVKALEDEGQLISSEIPAPVSETSSATRSPSSRTPIVTFPPSGV